MPFLATRLMLVTVGWLALQTFQGIPTGTAAWEIMSNGKVGPVKLLSPRAYPFVNMWSRWDAGWYYSVAKDGYKFVPGQQSNTAFFPTYPLAMRILRTIVRGRTALSYFASGIIISNLALLGALAYLMRLIELDADRATAARAALYVLAFPTTLFFSAVFTESMFLLTAVAAFYYARKERWLLAGLCGALATLTRSPGILLCLPLALEYLAQRKFDWRKIRPDLLALALIPAALAGLMLFFHARVGNMLATRDAQAAWGGNWGTLHGPWFPFFEMAQRHLLAHEWVDIAFTILALLLSIWAACSLRLSYGVYAVLCYLFHTSWGSLESMPRYILAIFPVFIVLAVWGRNELFHRAYLIIGSGLAAIFMLEFALWRW
ncbi:MAG: hypothetical protein M3Y86_01125, partial [Verrucomicrobiota bacterium]|nr:hypothetical protein [Verrucomicrobiota bacterium]